MKIIKYIFYNLFNRFTSFPVLVLTDLNTIPISFICLFLKYFYWVSPTFSIIIFLPLFFLFCFVFELKYVLNEYLMDGFYSVFRRWRLGILHCRLSFVLRLSSWKTVFSETGSCIQNCPSIYYHFIWIVNTY